MKNKKIFLIAYTIALILFNIKVEATTCTTSEEKSLKEEASAIEIIQVLNEEYNDEHIYNYSVNFINFSDKFYIMDSKNNVYDYYTRHTNDTLYGYYTPGKTVTFQIYGAQDKTCEYTLLRTIKINFNYYNDYSTYEECQGLDDFALCQRDYSGTIESEEWFYQKLEEYQNGTIEEEFIVESKNEKTQLEKIQTFIKENIFLTIIITIALILIIAYLIIHLKKRKKRIKINLD